MAGSKRIGSTCWRGAWKKGLESNGWENWIAKEGKHWKGEGRRGWGRGCKRGKEAGLGGRERVEERAEE